MRGMERGLFAGRTAVVALAVLLASALLLLPAAHAATVDLESDDPTKEARFTIPESVDVLNQHNFDAYVFSKRKEPQAWIVFLYAPWCEHCRGLMPQFINASVLLEKEVQLPHARFAVVNAQLSPKLTDRFHATSFPTIIYTTGDGLSWHRFDGGHSTDSFMEFAVYLQRAVQTGSFADDVSDADKFAAVEAEGGSFRVPFYIYIPKESASTREKQRGAGWSIAVDGAASIGNVRFGVIYESAMTPGWESEGSASYRRVIEAAQQCKREGYATGPEGEVLVSCSDRFRTPQCFKGPWLTSGNETVKSGRSLFREPRRLSPVLERYITVNGFRAVEELNGGMFSVLSKQEMNYLGLIVVDGPLDQSDPNVLPTIRDMVQTANERLDHLPTAEALSMPQVTWAYIDGTTYELWRTRYDIKAEEMPAFLLVDTVRNRLFRARTRQPEFEKIKRNVPWAIHGSQREMLEQLITDALSGKYWGEKISFAGYLAERLSYPRVTAWMYRAVRYDDVTFLIVLFALSFFTFIIFIAFVAEPMLERNLQNHAAMAAEAMLKKTQ